MSGHKPASSEAARRGIKIKHIGATWWSKRWIETIEHLSRDSLNRLGRGRAYARAGHVHDLKIAPGRVQASVTDADDEIYSVSMRVAVLPSASWQKVIETMSKQALFAAELLSGRMPPTIDEAFRAAGHSLFLGKQRELEADCTCADWVSPCKHVAAVHYVLSEAFDKDPFLLFELRGRTRAQVLGALRAARMGDLTATQPGANATRAKARTAIDPKNDEAAESLAATPACGENIAPFKSDDFERCPTPLPALAFRIESPAVGGALLRQLGAPPSWNNDDASFDALIKLYRAASRRACELALPEALRTKPRRRGRAKTSR